MYIAKALNFTLDPVELPSLRTNCAQSMKDWRSLLMSTKRRSSSTAILPSSATSYWNVERSWISRLNRSRILCRYSIRGRMRRLKGLSSRWRKILRMYLRNSFLLGGEGWSSRDGLIGTRWTMKMQRRSRVQSIIIRVCRSRWVRHGAIRWWQWADDVITS